MTRRFGIAAGVLVAAVTVYLVVTWPGEPRYQGRSLSAWLAMLDDREGGNYIYMRLDTQPPAAPTKEQLEAAEAVRQMGSKAVPELLRMLQTEEPAWRRVFRGLRVWLLRSQTPRPSTQADWSTAEATTRHRAALGLIALNPTDKPAVAQLLPLFKKPPLSQGAALVLASMGTQGLEPLRSEITNNRPTVPWGGGFAIWALAQFPTNGHAIAPYLVRDLTNARPRFPMVSAWALTRIQTDPEAAVQALTNHIEEPGMRDLCLKALANYGPRAKSAVPFLIDMVRRSQKGARPQDVIETLKAIDLEASVKAWGYVWDVPNAEEMHANR
jgi:hypothetical protein